MECSTICDPPPMAPSFTSVRCTPPWIWWIIYISCLYSALRKYKKFDCCTLQISWKSRCHMTTLPKHDRYPINMINITVSTKCQQIKTYAHIREKNKTKLTAITSSKGYLYTLTGDWYFCTILSLCYNFVEFSAPFITPFHTKLIDIRM